ncbi:TlpA family protein disulfide reductase [Thalassomonas actiniarum]|uniref:TlpA family protein disulfide reductase n=1 Tax=Thalassomonas actiniarum TaxID=485447 RepID=A0AAE9YHG0_9GAMM|nr:TlpA disulfide reductase family protein [Thalassomonas actiniarum]WDD96635.1 TlpA family protein disulfide reductase [Thalassomonas actiniarum]
MKFPPYIVFSVLAPLLSGCALLPAPANDAPAVDMSFLVKPGQLLPLTKLNDITGEHVVLNTPGRKKLVILFATWCADSQRAMKALHQSPLIQDKSLDIVAIAREQQNTELASWAAENEIKVTLVADADRSIYRQFAHAGIPRFIMVDEQNRIVETVLAEGEQQIEHIRW